MDPSSGANTHPESPLRAPSQHEQTSNVTTNAYSSRKDRSLSPRGGGYRRSSYSPRRRRLAGKIDDGRGYRDHFYSERRGPPRRSKPVERGSDKDRRDSTTLYVGNLPYAFREQDVADMFERYGRLRKVTVQLDHYTGRNKGFAFVEFEDRRDAEDAYDKYNGFSVEGRRLKLDWDIGLTKKDQHRREKHNNFADYGRASDTYGRGASPPPMRAFSPNYRTGGRSQSPYRR
ncbi:1369_t:CDS:2 [Ambispora leptoticha]|uniref:1369_t:CDS:1 n=1 Tax=Ambispora leptoticha TaxID=144679 RepID=A0A9N9N2Q6_9GLOM|nr:1369_t:CDS:2 [Ambispora leptoticha]